MPRPIEIAIVLLLAPLIVAVSLAVALAVRLRLGSPVLFRQTRIGRDGVPFSLLKFRSMSEERDALGRPLPDAVRLGAFGRRLRASSLDELPAFWNVLKGEMSLVGPRPLLPEYLPYYTPLEARRHEVRPGVTGWAQVNGRNALDWERKLALDVWYVTHRSLGLDLRILLMTVARVLRRDGIAAPGSETMPRLDAVRAAPADDRAPVERSLAEGD